MLLKRLSNINTLKTLVYLNQRFLYVRRNTSIYSGDGRGNMGRRALRSEVFSENYSKQDTKSRHTYRSFFGKGRRIDEWFYRGRATVKGNFNIIHNGNRYDKILYNEN